VEHGEWSAVNGTLTSLLIFYDTASWFHEGLQVFEFAAERLNSAAITDEQQAVLGRLITRQGVFTMRLDRIPRARDLLASGLEIARRKGTPADASTALNYLGWLAYLCGHLREGRRLLQESVDLCRPLGDRFATAIALNNLGAITEELGDYAQAQRLLEESLAIKRDLGDRRGMAFALGDLSSIVMQQGDYARGARLCHEGNTIMLEIGDRWAQPGFVSSLGIIAYFRGNYVEAEQQMAGPLEAMRAVGFDTKWQALVQLWLGGVYCATSRCAQAKELMQRSVAALVVVDRVTAAYAGVELALVEAILGDCATAERRAAESLAAAREADVPPLVAEALGALGTIAYLQGRYTIAQELCQEALVMFQAMGERHGIADCLNTLGRAAVALEDYGIAGKHLSLAQAIADETGAVPLAREVQVSRAELVLAELGSAAPSENAARQVEELLTQPLRDARASVHTRERAEKVQARLQGRLRS
jgi:tetratricopeptide (TPR) repeat protein